MKKTISGAIILLVLVMSSASVTQAQWNTNGNWLGIGKWLGTTNTQPIIFKTANLERMRIQADGNIGINTLSTSPSIQLEIKNGILLLNGTTSAGGAMMVFKGNTASTYYADWGIECVPPSQGNPGLNFWKPFGSPNWGNNKFFLAENGNVGINTNNPTATFTVNGYVLVGDAATTLPSAGMPLGYQLYVQTGILTEKVKVAIKNTANWSDFVFNRDFKLNSLEDVEKYVLQNGHLPNIPSASEVVKEGIDLAVIDSKLLEKIEELTLYIIEQNKKMDRLEKEVSILTGK